MTTGDSSTQLSLRRPECGAVLVVVMLAMIALLGLGPHRPVPDQWKHPDELEHQHAQPGALCRRGRHSGRQECSQPDPRAGLFPAAGRYAQRLQPKRHPDFPARGHLHEIPWDPVGGCLGTDVDGTPRRGAYLRDNPGSGCRSDTSAYINCNYPSYPNSAVPLLTTRQRLTTTIPYSLNTWARTPCSFVRTWPSADRACSLSRTPPANPQVLPLSNGIVVIRSEGVASDNRTKVVLEVTLSPNPNSTQIQQGIATVCPAAQRAATTMRPSSKALPSAAA